MASGEIRLSGTMSRRMPVLAQSPIVGGGGTSGGGGATGSWDDANPTATIDSWLRAPVPTFPGLNDPNYFSDVGSGAAVAGATGAGAAWSAGLDGGLNPVFYSGDGALAYANTLGGTTMGETAIGGFLARLPASPITTGFINIGSATFALNAGFNGSATAVITASGATWSTWELPILNFLRTAVTYMVPPL
jgi:hypothetical protein